jgi:hypothetical protein
MQVLARGALAGGCVSCLRQQVALHRPHWINQQLGMSGQVIRRDRILDEAHATGGDIRALTDLFWLTAAGAMPYVVSVNRTTGPWT